MENKPTLSFEVFPPNTHTGNEKIVETLQELQGLKPDFISVTCSNNKMDIEETTVYLANYVQNTLKITAVAHLPAVYLTRQKVANVLEELDKVGVNRVLALRGDIIEDTEPKNDFRHARDLVRFIKAYAPHFEVEGACYPEVHPESSSQVSDIKYLKEKVEEGCSHLISQLFLDNEIYYDFLEKSAIGGIDVPILAGIMPIINRNQALRLIKTTRTRIPRKFNAILEKYIDNPVALRDAGIAYAVDQIVDLVTQGVSGVHLYTMNNADTADRIHTLTASLFAY
ncbi:MAG: methylenetetrahydrofolate reductase [NAD(P)H] [Clostridiales bacterium]|nr:methylenetetrahydrofolate reductase [NAD(P)H] [Clostridiales bacterium]MDU1042327.1 methylenetetrahydrofolate reductase [NAD(P)H] [Clostridiales bacterium]MDU3490749.1 methylenetetrahydrofolate reductase [NAD(P)H] [Clostridiales bacterium]